jgi:hypothetical protein
MSSKSSRGGCACACSVGHSSSLFPLQVAVVVYVGAHLCCRSILLYVDSFIILQWFMMAYVHRSLPQKSCPDDELAKEG